jgi:hypothetical protein
VKEMDKWELVNLLYEERSYWKNKEGRLRKMFPKFPIKYLGAMARRKQCDRFIEKYTQATLKEAEKNLSSIS